MGLFAAKCPVSPEAQQWIESSMTWLVGQFGDGALRGDVMLPEEVFKGSQYSGSPDDLDRLLRLVCARMGSERGTIDLEITEEGPETALARLAPINLPRDGEAGHYRQDGDRSIIALAQRQTQDPVGTVATLAHEVGHVRLLGEGRITTDRKDHEQLTDLTTVFFGFGVFSANAAYEFSQTNRGWRSSALGYLGERLFGYALAYYAHLRDEDDPYWAHDLDTNPRVYMKQGLRYLGSQRR